MAHPTSGPLIGRVEAAATTVSALLLLAAAGAAILVAVGDPGAASLCPSGTPISATGAAEAAHCLDRAGFTPAAGFGLGAVAVATLAALFGAMRARAEDRALADTMRAVIDHAAAREREA
jgi:hypothetical protein